MAAATINKEALADAMRERRDELRLSQDAAAERSRELDLKFLGGGQRTFPGVSLKTWANLEQCKSDKPYPHTLLLVDATLRWPTGTAKALFYGDPAPDGPPPTPDESPDVEVNSTKAEVLRARAEVSDLRDVVTAVAERQDRIQESIDLILQALRGGV